jgi:pyruvate dehydrogenase E1 component alpha subunit
VRENGPVLLVCKTYRFKGHSKSDANRYRSKEEIEEWKKRDPIPQLRARIEKNKSLSKKELDTIEERAKTDIEEAVEFAQASPTPSIETILDDVYA